MEKQTTIVKKPFNIGQSKITAGFLAEICGFVAGYLVFIGGNLTDMGSVKRSRAFSCPTMEY